MAFVSRDFKPRRTPPPPAGPRKIPVVRFLILIAIGYFAFVHQDQLKTNIVNIVPVLQQKWNDFKTSDADTAKTVIGRKEARALAGGKSFRLPKGSIQESWRIQNQARLETVLDFYQDPRIQSIVRSICKKDMGAFQPGVLDLVFKDTTEGQLPLFVQYTDSTSSRMILRMPLNPVGEDYRYFDLSSQCVWLEDCPIEPLAGGAVPIPLDFDFGGREHLLVNDLFRGIGETPVVAVLPGIISEIKTDSLRGTLVEIQHDNNIITRSLGLAGLAQGISVGSMVAQGQSIGRLSARDTVELVFQVLRNGQFTRWESFVKDSRPVEGSVISTFLKSLQL